MGSFLVQRLSQTIFVVLAAALVSFMMFRYVGDPVNNMVGQAASMADREAMRRALGLEDPVILQFLRFLRERDDGRSRRVLSLRRSGRPAADGALAGDAGAQPLRHAGRDARSAFRSAYGPRCIGAASPATC